MRSKKQWFVAQCKSSQEAVARDRLLRQGFTVFLPMLRREEWPEQRTEPLFPCYLFVHFNPSKVSAAPIRNTKGVLGLVRFGDVIPAVPKEVIEQLQQLAPSGLWIVPKDLFDIHERVRITHGALANVIARIGEHDKGQRKLLLYEVLGSANRVSVPRELLTRA